jgi:hypothetical protein
VRVDIRSAINLALDDPALVPSTMVEIGWASHESRPIETELNPTKIIPSERHPIWNTQFLIRNPPSITDVEGYLYIGLRHKDKTRDDSKDEWIDQIYLPIGSMEPFLPIHWEFLSSKKSYKEQGKIYISTVLETTKSGGETQELIDVVVHNAFFDPPPPETVNRFFIGMKIYNPRPSDITFYEFD